MTLPALACQSIRLNITARYGVLGQVDLLHISPSSFSYKVDWQWQYDTGSMLLDETSASVALLLASFRQIDSCCTFLISIQRMCRSCFFRSLTWHSSRRRDRWLHIWENAGYNFRQVIASSPPPPPPPPLFPPPSYPLVLWIIDVLTSTGLSIQEAYYQILGVYQHWRSFAVSSVSSKQSLCGRRSSATQEVSVSDTSKACEQ